LFAIPDPSTERNVLAIEVPKLGSYIGSGTWDSREFGLEAFVQEDRPPVIIPFFAFRIMVGMGLIMLATSWWGIVLRWRGILETSRCILIIPNRLRRGTLRLVHRRGRPAAMGRLWDTPH
jgi:cytochrome bd ubiquinol oxidase subunit I